MKMRVLWLCNGTPACICEALGWAAGSGGGWTDQLAARLDSDEKIELCVCAPVLDAEKSVRAGWGSASWFYGFLKKKQPLHKYDKHLETVFGDMLREFQPDIVHIFGTEMPHTLAMVRAFAKPEKTVIHIQGLVSVCAKHYTAYLPEHVVRHNTFRDFVRHDNIRHQQEHFVRRGVFECEALQKVSHVMGRTEWDRACVKNIHPDIRYYHVQELLRSCFYTEDVWRADRRCAHRVFMSQGSYPLKGLHLALDAAAILKRKYPEIRLAVAGYNMAEHADLGSLIRESSYQNYIRKKIRELHLEDNIEFVGRLSAEEMKKEYLKCHVFLSASSIENSSNSLGEAMMLGVPVVASNVGGIGSLLTHEREGLLYAADEPYMMAYQIEKLFEDDALCAQYGSKAHERAAEQYDRDKVFEALMHVYDKMQ